MFLKIVMHDGEYTADEVLAIALLAVAANKTPQVVRADEAIQAALEDKNVYVLGGGRTSPLRKNFDGEGHPAGLLPLVVKYLEGAFPEGWQVPEISLTGDFSLDLARAIEMVEKQVL